MSDSDPGDSQRGSLYFLRHGQACSNKDASYLDYDNVNFLTPLGVSQAELAGAYFASRSITFRFIITSNLLRARQTGEIIRHWQSTIPGSPGSLLVPLDSLNELRMEPRDRIYKAWEAIQATWVKGDCLVVSHAWVMRVLWLDCMHIPSCGIPGPTFSTKGIIPIDNARPYRYDAACNLIESINPLEGE